MIVSIAADGVTRHKDGCGRRGIHTVCWERFLDIVDAIVPSPFQPGLLNKKLCDSQLRWGHFEIGANDAAGGLESC